MSLPARLPAPTQSFFGQSEQTILKRSIAATILIAVLGIGLGLVSRSFSLMFDGMYAVIDAIMSVLALVVSQLIAKDSRGEIRSRRFLMGFWHLEPMVLAFNGILLATVSVYALINAIGLLIAGGNDLSFGWALIYAVVVVIISILMVAYEWRENKRIKSAFIALDMRAWMMAGGITLALLIAFAFGMLIEDTRWAYLTPYIDPAALALVCIVIIPLPYSSVKAAIFDIMLIAPQDLSVMIDKVAAKTCQKYGFSGHTAYVAKVGRSREIELCFILNEGKANMTVKEADRIRNEVSDQIGGEGPHRWLTISFTTDPKWSV